MIPNNREVIMAASLPKQQPALRSTTLNRRAALQVGTIGMLGLGLHNLPAFRQSAIAAGSPATKARSVIYIFLSGGLSQLDSFDPKPEAPDSIRSEFGVTATRTPGFHLCEHLPLLAQRSAQW